MALRLIGRSPVQHVLEGYANPGDPYITFPHAKNINPTPNRYQVRPGTGMWLVTLTASDPEASIRLAIQNGVEIWGKGSVSGCDYITNPTYWVLCSPGAVKQATRYVLTLTKTAPPLRNCKILGWWSRWR